MHPGTQLNQDNNMLHIMFSSHSEFVASSPAKISGNMRNIKVVKSNGLSLPTETVKI